MTVLSPDEIAVVVGRLEEAEREIRELCSPEATADANGPAERLRRLREAEGNLQAARLLLERALAGDDGERGALATESHAARSEIASGQPVRKVGSHINLADLERSWEAEHAAEDGLRASSANLARLLERLPVAMVVAREDGTIQSFNRRAVELFGRSATVATTFSAFLESILPLSEERRTMERALARLRESARADTFEPALHPDGAPSGGRRKGRRLRLFRRRRPRRLDGERPDRRPSPAGRERSPRANRRGEHRRGLRLRRDDPSLPEREPERARQHRLPARRAPETDAARHQAGAHGGGVRGEARASEVRSGPGGEVRDCPRAERRDALPRRGSPPDVGGGGRPGLRGHHP